MELPQIVSTYIATFCRGVLDACLATFAPDGTYISASTSQTFQDQPSKTSLANTLLASQTRPVRRWRSMRSLKTWRSGAGWCMAPTLAPFEVFLRQAAAWSCEDVISLPSGRAWCSGSKAMLIAWACCNNSAWFLHQERSGNHLTPPFQLRGKELSTKR